MAKGAKARAKIPKARERELEALKYRKLGMSYQQIADRMDMSLAGAYKAVKRAIARITKEADDVAEEVRAIELQRLDELTLTYQPRAMKGDEKAAKLVIQVMDRRAKLLGIDAPSKQEISGDISPVIVRFPECDLDK